MTSHAAERADEAAAPLTSVLQDALPRILDRSAQADLLFLERWEIAPQGGTGPALRVQQIRRANPQLAAAIRDEIARRRPAAPRAG